MSLGEGIRDYSSHVGQRGAPAAPPPPLCPAAHYVRATACGRTLANWSVAHSETAPCFFPLNKEGAVLRHPKDLVLSWRGLARTRVSACHWGPTIRLLARHTSLSLSL